MLSIRLTQVFFLLAFVYLTSSLPVRDEDEMEGFLPEIRHSNDAWPLSGLNSADAVLEARLRQLLTTGLERRRQLGDIEFSNKYAEYLRSKAKHSSFCAFLRRRQGVNKSGVMGDPERVNQLMRQYMCPPAYSDWATDL